MFPVHIMFVMPGKAEVIVFEICVFIGNTGSQCIIIINAFKGIWSVHGCVFSIIIAINLVFKLVIIPACFNNVCGVDLIVTQQVQALRVPVRPYIDMNNENKEIVLLIKTYINVISFIFLP